MEVRPHERDDALTNDRRRPIFGAASDPTPDLFTSSCPHPYTTSSSGIVHEGDTAICSACGLVRGTFGVRKDGEIFLRAPFHLTVTTGAPTPRVGAWIASLVTPEGRRLVPISEVPAIQRGDYFSTLGPPKDGVIGWKVYGGISRTADSPYYEVRWVDTETPAGSAV